MATYNHSKKEDVVDAEAEEVIREKQRLEDIRFILDTPQGQRMFKEMFAMGHIENEFFKGNSSDAYNLGGRNFALHYWNLCKLADPKTLFRVVLEIEKENYE